MPDPLGNIGFTWPYYAAVLVGYLLGSIPFGLILTWLSGQGDIRAVGSGNIGATNVLRTGHKGLAVLTLILDAGKGATAAGAGGLLYGPDFAVLAGGGAMLGHLFPIWLRFKGGKGVATGFGVLVAVWWPVGLLVGAIWLATVLLFRYSSLAALAASCAAPFFAWWLADLQVTEFAAFVAVLVWLRHIPNLRRLLQGEEPKIGGGK